MTTAKGKGPDDRGEATTPAPTPVPDPGPGRALMVCKVCQRDENQVPGTWVDADLCGECGAPPAPPNRSVTRAHIDDHPEPGREARVRVSCPTCGQTNVVRVVIPADQLQAPAPGSLLE